MKTNVKTNMKTNATPKAISATGAHTQYGRRPPTVAVVLLFLSLAALGFFLTACQEAQNSLDALQYTCTNGTASSGSTTSAETENCIECNDGYYLTGLNTCEQRGVYTCVGGTEKGSYTEDSNDIEFCIDCDENHYLINNRCEPRGIFTCQNGARKLGTTPDGQNIEFCTECYDGYYLTGNSCEALGVFTCQNGTNKQGRTSDANDIEFCTECNEGHYLTNDRCEPLGTFTCSHGTARPGTTQDGNSQEHCVLCNAGYWLTNANRCESQGVFTCQNGTQKLGNTPEGTNIEFCTECSAGYYLTGNRCEALGVYTCTNGTKKEGNTTDGSSVEYCTECDDGFYIDDNICKKIGKYFCNNGDAKTGNTPSGNAEESCTECRSEYWLTNNKCEPRGTYTCSNGTKRTGYTQDGNNVEHCISCGANYYQTPQNTCAARGVYTCTNGDARQDRTPDGTDREHCTGCVTSHYLTSGNRCAQRGTYTCTNGTARQGYTSGSSNVEHCTQCINSHYLTSGNRCAQRGTYTCTNGTARTGYTSNSNNVEHCTECANTHYLTSANRCEQRGTYTCQSGTAKEGYTSNSSNVEHCTECANSIFSLKNNQCRLPNTDFRPSILEGVCNQSSGFVPTTYNSSGVPLNGSSVSVEGRATPYTFTNLTTIQKLECFKHAYTRENLPSTKPRVSKLDTDALPDGMLYDHDDYELIFKDIFGVSNTKNQISGNNHYDYTKVLDSDKWKVHVGGRSTYPNKTSAVVKQHNWPVFIKDTSLYLGVPRVRVADAPTDYYGECAYDEEREGYYVGDWRRNSCECDETRADHCAVFGTTINLLGGNGDHLRWRYGYLEVDVEQLFDGLHGWGCCTRALGQIEIRRITSWLSAIKADWWDKDSRFSGGLPNFYNGITAQQKELAHFGVEFQLYEKYAKKNHAGANAWLVLHYNQVNRDLPNGRFWQTLVYDKGELGRKVKRKYGIEWTPKGYKIWYNDSAWRNDSSDIKIFDLYDGNKDHEIRHDGACHGSKKLDSDGFLQCGVSHALQDFLIRTDAFSIPARVENSYYIINSVRLWKPKNNYADIAPVYE